jgi:acetolactate synthase-1/2/3 large subunit
VFDIAGDGSFQMNIQELGTVAANNIPVKVAILNNCFLGMVRQWQELFFNNRTCAVELDCFPDVEKLAAAYGIKGRTIERPDDLGPALEEAVREPGPYLLNIKVSQCENVYPMVPPGAALNEMVLAPREPVAVTK